MRDELFDRDYQAARADLNAGIDHGLLRLGRVVVTGFRVLNRLQWAAPWKRQATCR